MPSAPSAEPTPKQPLRCLRCNHYLGRYTRDSPQTIDQELYCMRCKGHTQFVAKDGLLTPTVFVPNPPRP